MYKVLIVDDEPLVVNGIRNRIGWKALGLEVVGVAGDGLEALSIVLDAMPDIVLTDINMPVMDGLAFISKLRESEIDAEIIVLSGYSEFEYARRALQYGVTEYLLKPCREEDIETALKKTLSKIEEAGKLKNAMEALKSTQTMTQHVLRENLLLYILTRNSTDVSLSTRSLTEVMPEIARSRLAVSIIDIPSQENGVSTSKATLYQAANICDEIMAARKYGISAKLDENSLVAITLFDKDASDLSKRRRTLHERIIRSIKNYTGVPVRMYTGGFVDDPELMTESYQQAVLCLQNRSFYEDSDLLFYDDLKDQAGIDPDGVTKTIVEYVENNYHKQITLNDIARQLFLTPNYLTTLFKKNTGVSFKKYLTNYRLRQAKQFLKDRRFRIADVATLVGYESDEYFCRVFKQTIGCTPSEYRRRKLTSE